MNGPTGPKGHKGSIGWSSDTPEWMITIIQFRNDKYHEDALKYNSEGKSLENDLDPAYDKIDEAILKLNSAIIKLIQ